MSIERFPGEDECRADLERSLACELDFARRLYSFWIRHPKDEWLDRSTLPAQTLDLAMLLNVQLYRQFRSVYEECSRCEAFCASIVSRSLFETTVGLLFCLKPQVNIIVAPVMKHGAHAKTADGRLRWSANPPSKVNPRSKSNFVSREMRANLYFAHMAFEDPMFVEKCLNADGLKRIGGLIAKHVDHSLIAHFEGLIGPEWTYVLKKSQSYSGLSIRQLAHLLDRSLGRWYQTIYHFQSRMVHASDVLRHVAEKHGQLGPQCLSTAAEVSAALETGNTLFLSALVLMHGHIGFGPAMSLAVDGFKKEFAEINGNAK